MDKTETKDCFDMGETETKDHSDMDETEIENCSDLDDAGIEDCSDLEVTEVEDCFDMDESEIKDCFEGCNYYTEYILGLGPQTTVEYKQRCIDRLASSIEEITAYPVYQDVLRSIIVRLLKTLISEEPHYITNHPINLLKKSILNFFISMPREKLSKGHIAPLLHVMYMIFSDENEENAIIILKLIRRYHTFCRVRNVYIFIKSIKNIYESVSKYEWDVFSNFDAMQLENLSDAECETYSRKINSAICIGKASNEVEKMTKLLLPASTNSFKVLAQLPCLLKSFLENDKLEHYFDMEEFMDVLVKTILIRPENGFKKHSSAMLFMVSQVKTVGFLVDLLYTNKFRPMMLPHLSALADTVMYLFRNLPHDAILLRKELLHVTEDLFIFESALKVFVDQLPEVTKEGIIIAGEGSLRCSAFTVVCRILLQAPKALSVENFEKAICALSNKFYDENITLEHQVLLCFCLTEMLKKISEWIEKSPKNVMGLLLHLLEFFIIKMEAFTKLLEPLLMQRCPKSRSPPDKKTHQKEGILTSKIMKNYKENKNVFEFVMGLNIFGEKKQSLFGSSASPLQECNVMRHFAKCLIGAVKEVTLMLHNLKYFENFPPEKNFLFGEFLEYGLKLTSLWRLRLHPRVQQRQQLTAEAEVLNTIAEVLALLSPTMTKTTLRSRVKEMLKFVGQPWFKTFTQALVKVDATCDAFGTLLLNYFLDHFETFEDEPFSNAKISYFADSFSLMAFQPEIEQMQLPALFPLVVKRILKFIPKTQMQLEYLEFLLKLCRSLKASEEDCIFHEFVSSLSFIVHTFDSWLNISLKPELKNILLELCLLIPCHFCALNSHLSFVFRATVSALNGPQHSIVLALDTLEEIFLGLEWNEFQCEIMPVKQELIIALKKTANNHEDSVHQTARRILDYLNADSRITTIEEQKGNYKFDDTGPSFAISFRDHKSSVSFPMMKVIDAVLQTALNENSERVYCFESWKVIKGLVCAMLNNIAVQIQGAQLIPMRLSADPFSSDIKEVHRSVYGKLLLSMFITANSLREKDMMVFCKEIVMYCTLLYMNIEGVALCDNQEAIDPFGLIDALFDTRLYEEGCLTEDNGCLALSAFETVIQTAVSAVGHDKFYDLKLLQLMTDKMCFLCYGESTASKLSGCLIIQFFVNKKLSTWIYNNLAKILKAVLYSVGSLIFDATDKRVDYSKKIFDELLMLVFDSEANEKFLKDQSKAKTCILPELFAQLFHADECIRKQTMNFLKMFAEKLKRNVADIMKPHAEALRAKIFLPSVHFRDLPSNSLAALLDVLVFCVELDPPIFKIDTKMIEELRFLCDTEKYLQLMPESKFLKDNMKLVNAALQALSVCISADNKEIILPSLCRALSCNIPEVHETAVQCLSTVSPLLGKNVDVEKVVPNIMKSEPSKLNKFSQIFHTYFKPEQRERIMNCFVQYFENCKKDGSTYISADSEAIVDFINVSCLIGVDSKSVLLSLKKIIFTIFDVVNILEVEHSSPVYEHLTKLLKKYPKETMHLLIDETCCCNERMTSFLEVLLNDVDNKVFLEVLQPESLLLISLLTGENMKNLKLDARSNESSTSFAVRSQCLGIRLLFEISICNEKYLSSHLDIAEHLTEVWMSSHFQKYFAETEPTDKFSLKSYRLLACFLLNRFKKNPSKVELLFQLIQAFVTNTSVNLKFLRDFLVDVVAKRYDVTWKRKAFFRFIEMYSESSYSEEFKIKLLKLIFIPSFSVTFCLGETEKLICGLNKSKNVFVEFIDKILDSSALDTFSIESKIIILQFSAILTHFGRDYLVERSKKYTNKLVKFALSCLQPEYDLYPLMKYHSYVLLLAIMGKDASRRNDIVSMIFQDVLKAEDVELKFAINSTFCYLIPDLSHADLNSFTAKAIKNSTEDSSEYIHILKMLINYYKAFYPICQQFVSLILQSAKKFSLSNNLRKQTIAVDLIETIIRWKIIYNEVSASKVAKQSSGATSFGAGCDPVFETDNEIESTVADILFQMVDSVAKQSLDVTSFEAESDAFDDTNNEIASSMIATLFQVIYSVNGYTSTEEPSSGEHVTLRKKLSQKAFELLTDIFSKNVFPLIIKKYLSSLLGRREKSEEQAFLIQPASMCIELNLLLLVLKNMENEDALLLLSHMQPTIASLLWCKDAEVLKTVCSLISLIFNRFPRDRGSCSKCSKDKHFAYFYMKMYEFVTEIFQEDGERCAKMEPSFLYLRIMVLSVICRHYPEYIDSFLVRFLKALIFIFMRVTKECTSSEQTILRILCIVTRRLEEMTWTAKKHFCTFLLLLSKSCISRVILTNIMEVFALCIKNSVSSDREHVLEHASMIVFVLFSRIKSDLEKDLDLNCKFFQFTVFLLSEKPSNSYVVSFLQHVIFYGWTSEKSRVHDICSSIMIKKCRPLLEERLKCILRLQWSESTGFWITSLIEFIFEAVEENYIQTENFCQLLTPISQSKNGSAIEESPQLTMLFQDLLRLFLELREMKTSPVLRSIAQLCHMDPFLSRDIWYNVFPQLWKLVAESQHNLKLMTWEIMKFLCLSNLKRVDVIPNPIETFIEAAVECVPRLPVSPEFYKVIVKKYGLEQRSCLLLEDLHFDSENKENLSACEQERASDLIVELYSSLEVEDLVSGLWQTRAAFLETRHGLMLEQEGNILKAKQVFADALEKYEFSIKSIRLECQPECDLWQNHWARCSERLGDRMARFYSTEIFKEVCALGVSQDEWLSIVLELRSGKEKMSDESKSDFRPLLPNFANLWSSSKDLEFNISSTEEVAAAKFMNSFVLPEVVTKKHKLLLQIAKDLKKLDAGEFICENSKGAIFKNVLKNLLALPPSFSFSAPICDEEIYFWSNAMHSVEKSYQNLCFIREKGQVVSSVEDDDFPNFKAFTSKCASQWSLKAARFFMNCEQSRLYQAIRSKLGVLDEPYWQDILEQLRHLLQKKAIDCEQPECLKYYSNNYYKDTVCASASIKDDPGIDLNISALKHDNSSVLFRDTEVPDRSETKMTWAEFLCLMFSKKRNIPCKTEDERKKWQEQGISAIQCFLQNCTLLGQSQSFVSISKVLWLLSYDDKECKLASAIGDYGVEIPAKYWLPWIPQLFSALFSEKPLHVSKILAHVAEKCPQDLFFRLRSFVLEYAESNKTGKGAPVKPVALPEGVQLCGKILSKIKAENPSLFLSLNRIADEMELLKGPVYEHILKLLKKIRNICYTILFQKVQNGDLSPATAELSHHIKMVVNLFIKEKGTENDPGSGSRKGNGTSLESFNNSFSSIKSKFCNDFYHFDSKSCDMQITLCKVNRYIAMLSDLSKLKKRQFYLYEKTNYLHTLHYERQDLKMFAKSPLENYETVHIARFLPQVEWELKGNTVARKLRIEGDDGKIYQYSLMFHEESAENRKIDRISDLQQVMNCLFPHIKNTAKQRLRFKIREAIFMNTHTCLVYEDDSAVSLLDIFEEHCSTVGIKSSAPLDAYYESIRASYEAGDSISGALEHIFASIQRKFVPQSLLKDWVHRVHSCAGDYWKFRTQFTQHAALLGLIEYVAGLSPQTPDHMYIQRNSGEMKFSNFQFSLLHEDGKSSRKAPFRLTPNICKFITPGGVEGTFGSTFLHAAECLKMQWWRIESVIKVFLMDELLSASRKKSSKSGNVYSSPDVFIPKVDRTVCEIYNRIGSLSSSEDHHVQLWKLISSAESCDNLSALDPYSYPWL